MATRAKTPANIDEYIESARSDIQPILEKTRRIISDAALGAQEVISYGMPAFRLHGILVYFAGFKNHIGLFPPVSGDEA